MKKVLLASWLFVNSALAQAAWVEGTINSVFAGSDTWFGVRFYLTVTNNQTNGECNIEFVYTEPEPGNGHKEKVAIFTSAYLSGKAVQMTVTAGRNGYCKLIEGKIF
jgi:hypothetical protein